MDEKDWVLIEWLLADALAEQPERLTYEERKRAEYLRDALHYQRETREQLAALHDPQVSMSP